MRCAGDRLVVVFKRFVHNHQLHRVVSPNEME